MNHCAIRSLVFALIIQVFCVAQQTNGQLPNGEIADETWRYHRVVSQSQWVYEITFDGMIHHNLMHRRVFRTPLSILKILTYPGIAKDLEIVEFQQKELNRQIDALNEACRLAEEEFSLPLTDANRRNQKILQILEPPIESSIEAIRELTLEDQKDRLRQILIQLEINRRGLLWFLESQLGSELGLTREQQSQIRKRYLELAEDWIQKVNEQKRQSVDRLLSAASESRLDDLKKALGNDRHLYHMPLKVLELQLDEQAISDFARYQVDSKWPEYAGITVPFAFEMDSLGHLVRIQPTKSPERYDDWIPSLLMVYCLADGELELVPTQKQAVAQLRQQQLNFWNARSEAFNAFVQANQTYVMPESLRKQRAREQAEFDNRIVKTIESILLPHQKAVLSEFAARTRFTLHGPVAAVLKTEPKPERAPDERTDDPTESTLHANELPLLSRIENHGLRALANQERKKIGRLLIKIERESNLALLKELTTEQRNQFRRLIGAPLKLECGNVELHLAYAKRPSEVQISSEQIWMEELQIDPQKMKPVKRDASTKN